MAVWLKQSRGDGRVVDYLLRLVGDSIDFSGLQYWIWLKFAENTYEFQACTVSDLQSYFQLSMRALDLEQTLDDKFISGFFFEEDTMYLLKSLDLGMIVEICGFLIEYGANIECKDLYDETALLKVVKSNLEGSPHWTRGLLQCGADILAVNFKKRGPPHLTLRYSKGPFNTQYTNYYFISLAGLKAKLVDLLVAGCSVDGHQLIMRAA